MATKFGIKHVEYRPGEFASILDVDGPIDGTSEAAFRREMDLLIRSGARQLILDCEDVHFINSAGLGAVLLYMDELERLGGKLVLARLSDRALMVVELLGFAPALDIVDDESQALAVIAEEMGGD
jgi:anti-anti-sigma factor